MALARDTKQNIIEDIFRRLKKSKIVVVVNYRGASVDALQRLRQSAIGTKIQIIKNRLVILALRGVGLDIDTSLLHGQLLYAFNDADELSPIKALAEFIKLNKGTDFIFAITEHGVINADEVKELSALHSKNDLLAQIVTMLTSPINDSISGICESNKG